MKRLNLFEQWPLMTPRWHLTPNSWTPYCPPPDDYCVQVSRKSIKAYLRRSIFKILNRGIHRYMYRYEISKLHHLCSRQRPPWTSPPQVFTSVHLLKKFVGSRFTISSPRSQNNWVKIHRHKKWDRSRFTKDRWNFCYGQDSHHCRKNWPHI